MPTRFVSECIQPVAGSIDPTAMAAGEPGLPRRFAWRGAEFAVAQVLEKWKETQPCSHGSKEQYLRKHWYRVETDDGKEMKIYFERQGRSAREAKKRWWLYTISDGADAADDGGS